ncbi:hypothetical protein MRBLMI12_000042 [Microbacterium sp. LMI12-1-1.1]|jgi:hypothetical protein|uniref:Uncharacterized protein n=1 Tax=Microbacterium sp. LWS13-1.2 TaxID=3135264 RepID=A0AAU6S8X1_9MICO
MPEPIADEDVVQRPTPDEPSAPESSRATGPSERSARGDAAERRRERPWLEHPWWGPMPADRHE